MKIDMETPYGELRVTPAEYLLFLKLGLIEAKIDGVITTVCETYGSFTTSKTRFENVRKSKDAWLGKLKNMYDNALRELMEVVKNAEGRKD